MMRRVAQGPDGRPLLVLGLGPDHKERLDNGELLLLSGAQMAEMGLPPIGVLVMCSEDVASMSERLNMPLQEKAS